MNRFKVAIGVVGMLQVMSAAALATQALNPPLYVLPPVAALALVVVNAGLVFLQASMPSWSESGRAARAVAREVPPRG